MKGKIKKLAVFVIVAVIVIITAVSIASVHNSDFKATHGEHGF